MSLLYSSTEGILVVKGRLYPSQLFMEAWCFNALWKIALEESFDGRGIIIGMGSAAFASCARFSERKC